MNDIAASRDRAWEALKGQSFDVLVIGGGVVGAGVARDASLRGLRTLLLEQSDFASGTSSRSSRLLHGGLRYLAQGSLGLVREASLEKLRLSRIAPHLCQPLPFIFPVWRGAKWPRWKLSLGVKLYDLLCGGQNLGASATLNAESVSRAVPTLLRTGLKGGVRYFDGFTNDARLVLDTLRSAASADAEVLNYAAFLSASRSGQGWECAIWDRLGDRRAGVRANLVVNAAGAWASKFPQSRVRLRLTKGVHLVVDRARLPINEAVVLAEGWRILFVIPWGQRVILGTTDTDYEGDPQAVRAEPEDIDYILNVVNAGFPEARIGVEDLIAAWAGVRPLIAPARGKQGAPSDISRRHEIRMTEPGWLDVAGGKLTTYRLMAEQAVDRIGRYLQLGLPRSRTAETPLTHGAASGVLPPPIEAAVVQECCRQEWAIHLDDVMLRRTSWHYYHPNRIGIGELCAAWMAAELGWTSEQTALELERYKSLGRMSTLPRAPATGRLG